MRKEEKDNLSRSRPHFLLILVIETGLVPRKWSGEVITQRGPAFASWGQGGSVVVETGDMNEIKEMRKLRCTGRSKKQGGKNRSHVAKNHVVS